MDDKDSEVKDSDMASTTPENSARALLPSNSIVQITEKPKSLTYIAGATKQLLTSQIFQSFLF
jgi:hypothetical protein